VRWRTDPNSTHGSSRRAYGPLRLDPWVIGGVVVIGGFVWLSFLNAEHPAAASAATSTTSTRLTSSECPIGFVWAS